MNKKERTCIIVLGMHRSGTSALTRIISLLGADLPQNLMKPNRNNPRGFWESEKLMDISQGFLKECRSNWDEWTKLDADMLSEDQYIYWKAVFKDLIEKEYHDSSLFVIKDPRICRFVNLIHDALKDLSVTTKFIIPFRNPLDVASSLSVRNNFSQSKGLLLWLRHILDASVATAGCPRVFTSYEDLMGDWRRVVKHISFQLDVDFPNDISEIQEAVNEFLTTELRHHAKDVSELILDESIANINDVYHQLMRLKKEPYNSEIVEMHKVLQSDYNKKYSLMLSVGTFVKDFYNKEKAYNLLSSEMKTLKKNQNTLISEKNNLEKQVSALQEQVLNAEKEFVVRREVLNRNSQELDSCKQDIAIGISRNKELQSEIVRERKIHAQLSEQIRWQKKSIKKLEDNFRSSRRLMKALLDKILHGPRDVSRRVRRSLVKKQDRKKSRRKSYDASTSSVVQKYLNNRYYRKYITSKFLLKFRRVLPNKFQRKMQRRMDKNSFSAFSVTKKTLEIDHKVSIEVCNNSDGREMTRRRAAVVCWDLGNNPAGRALVLVQILQKIYQHVDLIGPTYPESKGKIWGPIAGMSSINIITQSVSNYRDLEAFTKTIDKSRYDYVYMCKPRWPTIFMGLQIVAESKCKFALDIDDYELSFYKKSSEVKLLPNTFDLLSNNQLSITGVEATLLAHSIIKDMPSECITVSNVALQELFGGTIIRHARDENTFNPNNYDRIKTRADYGYTCQDKVIVFIGTIRRHKGCLDIIRAVQVLSNKYIKICLIGPIDGKDLEQEIDFLKIKLKGQISHYEGVTFENLPKTINMADLVCLPQEKDNETSKYQIPAKLTDALSMGVPAIVEDLPPFEDICKYDGVESRKGLSLSDAIMEVLNKDHLNRKSIRATFLSEFSVSENSKRLEENIQNTTCPNEQLIKKLSNNTIKVLSGSVNEVAKQLPVSFLIKGHRPDFVFLWKQNDSGLFGRRSDMISKYMLQDGYVGRALHFDTSVSLTDLEKIEAKALENPLTSAGLVKNNIISRNLGVKDDLQFYKYTYIYDNNNANYMGRSLPSRDQYPELLREKFKFLKLSQDAILWTWPVVPDVHDFFQAYDFKHIIADLVDDQREFTTKEKYKDYLTAQYTHLLSKSDVIFTNCEGSKRSFSDITSKNIKVVSNAAEKLEADKVRPIDIFKGEKVFKIGYAGNLRDRIDTELLIKIANYKEHWRLILVGPTGGNKDIESLANHPNISLVGPQLYDDACKFIAGFDVAIIPHLVNSLTETMNPLKLYLYQALGKPVVTTAVNNLTHIDESAIIANNTHDFLGKLEELEQNTSVSLNASNVKTASNYYWDDAVSEIVTTLKGTLGAYR